MVGVEGSDMQATKKWLVRHHRPRGANLLVHRFINVADPLQRIAPPLRNSSLLDLSGWEQPLHVAVPQELIHRYLMAHLWLRTRRGKDLT